MKCPNCGLINPENALICDCGYNFKTNTVEITAKETKLANISSNCKKSAFKDFFVFRKMITPIIIQIIFWLSVIGCIGFGIYMISEPWDLGLDEETGIWIGILIIVLGPLIIRLQMELVILFFRINETLTEIKNKITKI